MTINRVEQLIADYEAGDHSEALQEKIFKAVECAARMVPTTSRNWKTLMKQ